jgi:hypothetical protein
MENFCVNCDCKLTAFNENYPLWNKSEARLCSKCQKKADFFLSWVYSQESALDFYNNSKQNLVEAGFSPHGISYLENYCRFVDDAKLAKDNARNEENLTDITKASPSPENKVAKILTITARAIFILGFVVGFFMLSDSLRLAFSYWVGAFICGIFFIGIAEIIKLFQKISDK